MGGEVRKQPELRARQAHRPGTGRPGGRRHAVVQLPRLLDERAQVRAELEHPLGLGENRAGGARLAECEMGACELEPDFDGQPGNAVVEHAAADGGRAPAPLAPPRVGPRGVRPAPSRRARARCSRSRRDPSRRRSPVPPVRVRRPRPRPLAWPRGARAVPEPRRRRRPAAPRACAAVMDAFRSSVSRSVAPSSPCATPRMRSEPGIHQLPGGS